MGERAARFRGENGEADRSAVLRLERAVGECTGGPEFYRARRHIALRDGYAQLPLRCRELLALLFTDPPTPYLQISSQLDMKVGSIGPTRERCLSALRRTPALAELIEQERHYVRGEVDAR